ncbi:anthranilate synthase component I family protein [uncultured Microscilla sp.]|uniref:anthranilate synthase component I family protein n=1 Tax=uncultured Microscilla sp. TaxID=432653 RepID=UPI0026063185|nr:anthranilate synthase component I family protein [uncultured Microscilla sp.]
MKKYALKTRYRKLLADTLTPVGIYLKLRDKFANALLLESSDYHGADNSFSYICFQPIARFEVQQQQVNMLFPDDTRSTISLDKAGLSQANGQPPKDVVGHFEDFSNLFESEKLPFDFIYNGMFGYTSFDSIRYFEDLNFKTFTNDARQIPDILYQTYQYVIAINHFKNELYIFQHYYENAPRTTFEAELAEVENLIRSNNFPQYDFQIINKETSNISDEEYIAMVEKGIHHCRRGDVFQVVLSRQFSQQFLGDEFNVYRHLRSINPSPYLFYFDYGSFKIFGSSPEAQLVVSNQQATIHPIAGTIKRTGNDAADATLAKQLFADEKENAEHVMLVDLARNDLSRNGSGVQVEAFKEIQYYSHLIHMVSKVTANIDDKTSGIQLFADTFPAGTLSGAPKHKAIQLIDQYENQNRGFYGGAIGFLNFKGNMNQAIMIRSFLSKNNELYYQAGGGIVSKSSPKGELEEVNNKLRALRKAIEAADSVKSVVGSR